MFDKAKIDRMSIYQLLYENRFAPIGDKRFQGEEGEYRIKRLAELKEKDPELFAAESKRIGWESRQIGW